MIDDIERILSKRPLPGQQIEALVEWRYWDEARTLIAGFTHLPLREQLLAWAHSKGWKTVEDTKREAVVIIRREPSPAIGPDLEKIQRVMPARHGFKTGRR